MKPTFAPETRLTPFIDQTAGVPSTFCQNRSLWALPFEALTVCVLVSSVKIRLDAALTLPAMSCSSIDTVCMPSAEPSVANVGAVVA